MIALAGACGACGAACEASFSGFLLSSNAEANRPESVVVMVMMTVMMVRVMCVMRVRVMVLMVGTAGSTAVVEEALRNRFKDGKGARVLGRASAGQWLYLARTAASEINMGIASVRFLLFLLIAGA